MKQVLIIHGGSSFNSYDSYFDALKAKTLTYEQLLTNQKWRDWIADTYTNGDVLLPIFPNGSNAQYDEWVIYFEKLLPFLDKTSHLIGYSLGAMFLARYLHENTLAIPAARIILISPCYDDESTEELGSFKVTSAIGLEKSAQEVHLFHSKDDPISPFTELAKFQSDLPAAETHIFEDRNHFFQPIFPELLDLLNKKLPS
jgi:predicted alpha/beta hydrolase family esterase